MSWERIPEHFEMHPGERYRLTWIIQSPYPASLFRGIISSGVKGVEKLKGITVHEINFIPPDELVYIPQGGFIKGRYQPWEFNMVVSKSPPKLLEAGPSPNDLYAVIALVAGVLFALGLISILNRSAERFVESLTGDTEPPPPGSPPGTPGVHHPGLLPQIQGTALVLGLVIVGVLLFMRKGV